MTEHEIHEILTNVGTIPSEKCETDQVEFKNYRDENSLHNDKDLANEISALANHKGGVIIFGVENNDREGEDAIERQLQGFSVSDIHETTERLKGKIKPKVDIVLRLTTFQGKPYSYLNVPKVGWILVTTSSGKVYIRDGKSSRPMEPHEIEAAVKGLQSYDWSAEQLESARVDDLDKKSLASAKADFVQRRKIQENISDNEFLEAIGGLRNGVVTKTGLVFLGQHERIREMLGEYEYRFSFKTKTGELKKNEVWFSNIWTSISKFKQLFKECNTSISLEFEKRNYTLANLDEVAFHEALLNSIVHRDYSINGMISIVFSGTEIKIANPGSFYGGINEENIVSHEPRHRNKELAKCLMLFNLVDRAGMGVLRMGIGSLKYGRRLPEFRESNDSITVTMQTEYSIPQIFVLTQSAPDKFGLTELLLLNRVAEKGYVSCEEMLKLLAKLSPNPWEELVTSVEKSICSNYLEIVGSSIGLFVRVIPNYSKYFKLSRVFPSVPNGARYIKLYRLLRMHERATNDEIANYLELQTGAYLSKFLNNTSFVRKEGRTRSTRWLLREW